MGLKRSGLWMAPFGDWYEPGYQSSALMNWQTVELMREVWRDDEFCATWPLQRKNRMLVGTGYTASVNRDFMRKRW